MPTSEVEIIEVLPVVEVETIKDRVAALLTVAIEASDLPGPFLGVLKTFMAQYIAKMDDKQTEQMLTQMRDEIIPWLLFGEEMTSEEYLNDSD